MPRQRDASSNSRDRRIVVRRVEEEKEAGDRGRKMNRPKGTGERPVEAVRTGEQTPRRSPRRMKSVVTATAKKGARQSGEVDPTGPGKPGRRHQNGYKT